MVDDRNIEIAALRAQRDELHDALSAMMAARANEGRIPGVVDRLHDADLRCKKILAQTIRSKA